MTFWLHLIETADREAVTKSLATIPDASKGSPMHLALIDRLADLDAEAAAS